MTWLSDSTPLIPGCWLSSAYPGHGVRGDAIPAAGESGASILYNDVTLPAQAADEFRAVLLTPPAAGTLALFEDGSFSHTGAPDGVWPWTYRGYRNGTAYGDFTVTDTFGAVSGALAGNAAGVASAGGDLATAIRLAGAALAQAMAAGGLSTQIPLTGSALAQALASGGLSTQIPLTGGALAAAGASGSLTVQIAGLSGDALAQAAAGGSLATGIRLVGAALTVATAGGELFAAPVSLAGAALSASLAGGVLTASIRLAATAIARATAGGDLSGGSAANTLTAADIDPAYTVSLARDFTVSRVLRYGRH